MCTSRIFFKYTHLHRSIFVHFFSPSQFKLSSSRTDNRLCWVKYVYEIKRLTKDSYYPPTKYIVLCSRQFHLLFRVGKRDEEGKKMKWWSRRVYSIDKGSIRIQVECVILKKKSVRQHISNVSFAKISRMRMLLTLLQKWNSKMKMYHTC